MLSTMSWLVLGAALLLVGCASAAPVYPPEEIYDTAVYPDEALVNVGLASNRWPDCTTLRSAIHDIFRLEGAARGSDQDKALALWKWFRILVSASGGAYAYEGPKGQEKFVRGPHKIFTVYGHHQCDGMSWAMVPLWRAAGYMAFDECHLGHTWAALRYRDHDGKLRYHCFDPMGRYYWWDSQHNWVGTRSMPVMRAYVFRHLVLPRELHSLRTSLRIGETIERKWDNEGHIVPSGKDKLEAEKKKYYAYEPGKTKGIYAVAGEEVQTLEADSTPERFGRSLYECSRNVACSPTGAGKAVLHPKSPGKVAEFIYRLAPPYVVADASLQAALLKSSPSDLCRLSISTDGSHWQPIYVKEKVGEETVTVNIGKEAWKQELPNVYTAYNFFVKAEFRTTGDVRKVGMNRLKVVVHRMLNKRTLPNLRSGENYLKVTADRLAEGLHLELEVNYRVDGEPRQERRIIRQLPYYFKIDVPGVAERVLKNYDRDFNNGALQMVSVKMRLLPAEPLTGGAPSLPEAEVLPKFKESSPHPADMTNPREVRAYETDIMQTNGFFPQSTRVLDDDEAMNALIQKLKTGSVYERWKAAEDLGSYPKAVDALLEELPQANIDLTLFIVKALAQIKDRKAIAPLLEKWKRAPLGSPGTRYIPDALAAIGDPSVVPHLIEPLERCRFDFRFHIAHALGILGGPEAKKALRDLAEHDPFPPVREEAMKALQKLARSE